MSNQIDLFSTQQEVNVSGRIIDQRQLAGIEPARRYTPSEAAGILGCSERLIYELTGRPELARSNPSAARDARHWSDISPQRRYTQQQVAGLLSVSNGTVYKLRRTGLLQESPLRHSYRVPGWSLVDFIRENASPPSAADRLDFVSIFTVIRIPGWAIQDFIAANCTAL